jgi:Kef-type K+ transport system membrane component KefB
MIIIFLCRVLGFLFSYLKEPPVIAEVITGIILGPSVMGNYLRSCKLIFFLTIILGNVPGFTDAIFPASSISTFNVIANIGLILYMFMVGLEIDMKLMKRNVKQAVTISISAMIAPFALVSLSSKIFVHSLGFSQFVRNLYHGKFQRKICKFSSLCSCRTIYYCGKNCFILFNL